MANNFFKFKQFTILQEKSAMKVGTDGVLLGAWANIEQATSILDIGTGTGLIALMLAQRSKAIVDAIEIDEEAYNEAVFNINKSPWSSQINIHNQSLQEYASQKQKTFDLIVSNPPFFDNSLKANGQARSSARHTDTLTTAELFYGTSNLLNEQGKFAAIIPSDKLEQYKREAEKHMLYCNNILYIKPTPSKQVKRVLLEFTKKQYTIKEDILIIEEFGRHQYSEKYKQLTKEYYLAF